MIIKAVIFDMDGVMIKSEPLHKKAFEKIFKQYGMNINWARWKKIAKGRTDEEAFQDAIMQLKMKIGAMDLVKQKSQIYLELISEDVFEMKGIVDLINILHKKFKLAVTSNSSHAEIKAVLEKLNVEDFFDVIVSSSEDVTKGKPNPESYLLTARKLGLKPDECIVIEDSNTGVLAAKNAGMNCIGFHNGLEEQNLSKADFEVNSLEDIPKLISNQI